MQRDGERVGDAPRSGSRVLASPTARSPNPRRRSRRAGRHDAQLIPFWEDVEVKAIEVLEGESRFWHYMGALILAPIREAAQVGVTPRLRVVDDNSD